MPGLKGLFSSTRDYLTRATRHPLGFVGLNMAALSGLLLVTLLVLDSLGFHGNPYLGIVTFLVLPTVLVLGFLLIPVGEYRYKRRLAKRRQMVAKKLYPAIDLNIPAHRNRLTVFGIVMLANVTLLGVASYRGVEFMDSPEFCGLTCHEVMHPEWTAYQGSPHARVRCVDCHIGPGASWFVKSKLSGVAQVFATVLNTYPKPIPTPVHSLRPARDTCEQCHWPEKFHGDKVRVIEHFDDDRDNTPMTTVLLLRVGGGAGLHQGRGIHWHVMNRVEYVSDHTREKIYKVKVISRDGEVKEYVWEGEEPEGEVEERVMDCVDCHNRPTHIYKLPDQAVDEALAAGLIPRDLPYVRRRSLEVLRENYASTKEAVEKIPESFRAIYEQEDPEVARERSEDIERVGQVLVDIFRKNVFPEMNITWGTYPNHIGHENFPGCFRCHDDEHVTADGETISQDCATCHILLAVEEENPEILQALFPEE
jgi:hypothetical protein